MTKFTDMLDGYRRFRENDWKKERERWEELKEGQSPKVMIIACSDSRVDPTQIFDIHPGETFIVRNVAALGPPFELKHGYHGVSAALEFAVQFLKVEEIVVMGHGLCGGCEAALTQQMKDLPPGEGGFIADWIALLDDARAKVVAEHGEGNLRPTQLAMEHEGVKTSLSNLRTFPCIQEKEGNGSIRLIGAWFAISGGKLHVLDEQTDTFAEVA